MLYCQPLPIFLELLAFLLIIRISLLLVLAALPVFVLVESLLWLAVPALPGALTILASAMLLSGFSILIISGLLGCLKIIVRAILDYFSSKQRAQRQLWFVWDKKDRLERLFYFKTRQLRYFNELHRKRLLKRNDCKHLRVLSKSIDKNLLLLKTKLPKTIYLQLQQDHACFKSQQDIEALLTLQKKISTLM